MMWNPSKPIGLWRSSALAIFVGSLTLTVFSSDVAGQSPRQVSASEFTRWMEEISNWGRWGEDDELGTLNLITEEKRRAAAQLVQNGVSVSLARELNTRRDALNPRPFEHTLTVSKFGAHEVAGDIYSVRYHGFPTPTSTDCLISPTRVRCTTAFP